MERVENRAAAQVVSHGEAKRLEIVPGVGCHRARSNSGIGCQRGFLLIRLTLKYGRARMGSPLDVSLKLAEPRQAKSSRTPHPTGASRQAIVPRSSESRTRIAVDRLAAEENRRARIPSTPASPARFPAGWSSPGAVFVRRWSTRASNQPETRRCPVGNAQTGRKIAIHVAAGGPWIGRHPHRRFCRHRRLRRRNRRSDG